MKDRERERETEEVPEIEGDQEIKLINAISEVDWILDKKKGWFGDNEQNMDKAYRLVNSAVPMLISWY